MRPIKYKAYLKKHKKIVTVDVIDFIEEEITVIDEFGKEYYFWFNEIVLLQYTGLKDKNGREIYEGDIIEFFHDENTADTAERSPVEWFGREKWNYPAFDLHDFYILDHHFEGNALSEIISTGNYHYEIIGNIYEDKHLLEAQP